VRDIYAVGDDKLLLVATDRLSAYDVIMPTPIPEKGRVLTEVANFWFAKLAHIVPNHLTGIDPESVVAPGEREQVRGRAIVVKKLATLPIEAVVRGYLEGSGWKEYRETQSVCGIRLPPGLQRASKLPQPIFTPATKEQAGTHDENITFERMAQIVGEARAAEVRDVAIRLYVAAAEFALSKGIIIADTKFEFGIDAAGTLHLIDEVLTPDSSRFWPAACRPTRCGGAGSPRPPCAPTRRGAWAPPSSRKRPCASSASRSPPGNSSTTSAAGCRAPTRASTTCWTSSPRGTARPSSPTSAPCTGPSRRATGSSSASSA